MKTILAIDPGTIESAAVRWRDGILFAEIMPNEQLRSLLRANIEADTLAIEMVACYGMPVGKEVFETCLWIGRFQEIWLSKSNESRLCYRKDVKLHLCNSYKAKDSNVAQALRDRLGIVGTKNNPGPLYGIKSHLWQALAIAIYASET